MKLRLIFSFGVLAALVGCSAPGPRSMDDFAVKAAPLFKDKKGKLLLQWIPGSPSVAGAMASAMIGNVGLDSPTVADLHRRISAADTTPVNLAVAGEDSRFAAKVALSALNQVPGKLPMLTLGFIGDPADAAEVRTAVEAKGGTFLFAPAH